jgi:hypothetical protein
VSGGSRGPSRRSVLAASLAAVAPLAACSRRDAASYEGGWLGISSDRGHLLRDAVAATKSGALPEVSVTRRVGALVVGAGIAGLGAARAMQRAGLDDCHVLELEDGTGRGRGRGDRAARRARCSQDRRRQG